MLLVLLIVLLVLALGGGGWGHSRYGYWSWSPVCIMGQASEEGPAEHNEELSRKRSLAVQGYLAARGLAVGRMPTTGLGAHCQIVPETTRTLNRRVEFRRLQEGESCPTDCSAQVLKK